MKQPHGTSALAQLFGGELSVVNLGLESFADNLRACGVAVFHRPFDRQQPGAVVGGTCAGALPARACRHHVVARRALACRRLARPSWACACRYGPIGPGTAVYQW